MLLNLETAQKHFFFFLVNNFFVMYLVSTYKATCLDGSVSPTDFTKSHFFYLLTVYRGPQVTEITKIPVHRYTPLPLMVLFLFLLLLIPT